MQLPGMRGMRVRDLVRRAVADFLRDDMPTYAAAVAFHLFLSLFPFILFLLALLSFLDLQGLFEAMVAQGRLALPSQAMGAVEDVIEEISRRPRGGILSFGIVASVGISAVGMQAVMNALNQAYDVEETRPLHARWGYSLLYTLGFTALVVVATAMMVIGPQLASRLADFLGLEGVVVEAWQCLRFPVALGLAMLAVSLVYYFAPNLEQSFNLTSVGSVLAVLLWAVASVGFQLYVRNFGFYDLTYGSIAAVIVLLLYIFISAMILLFGGELNAELERSAPRRGDARPVRAGRRTARRTRRS